MKPGKNSARSRLKLIRTAAMAAGLALLLLPTVSRAQPSAPLKRVLVLYWYDKDYPGHIAFGQSFQAALQAASGGTFECYSEYLESNRFPGEKQELLLRDFLRQKYADRAIDVLVASTDVSLAFLLKYRADLFPHAPIVFEGPKRPTAKELAAGPGLTGIVRVNTQRETIDLALKLHPGTEQVFIISGTLERDQRYEITAREQLRGYENKVRLTYLTDLAPDELVAQTKSLPERSLIFYLWQQSLNKDGKLLETADVLALIAPSASVPIYGMSARHVGSGLLGGQVHTIEGVARRTAELVLRIAQGERAQDIPVEGAPTVPTFDWHQLHRWGISEDRLPAGSIVRFKEISFWQEYRRHLIVTITLIAVQTLLIAFLLLERAKRQRAMQKMRESEERFSKAFHSSPQPKSITTLEEDRYLDVNERFLEVSGYTREEVIGHTSLELNIWENLAARAELIQPLKEGKKVRNLETKFRTKSGQFRALLSSAELIELDGQPCVLVASSDITERKKAEADLNQLNAELEQRITARTAELATKTHELETFTYSVAHDLKAPLRGIEGYTRLLLEGSADQLDDEGRSFLQTIRASSEEMGQLIEDLLAYSRLERREMTRDRLELNPLITALVEQKKRETAGRKIEFILEVNGGTVVADTNGLAQALRNYLDNAIKFTRDAARPRIEVGVKDDECCYRVWVRDNGIGFDMKYHDQIFEIFQRLNRDEDYTGTGVGLAIVRKAVERMGGRAWGESELGQGATFYLEIPK